MDLITEAYLFHIEMSDGGPENFPPIDGHLTGIIPINSPGKGLSGQTTVDNSISLSQQNGLLQDTNSALSFTYPVGKNQDRVEFQLHSLTKLSIPPSALESVLYTMTRVISVI